MDLSFETILSDLDHPEFEDPDGVILNQPANVAFIGERLERMAVSSLGGWSLVAADVGVAGLPLRLPRLDRGGG